LNVSGFFDSFLRFLDDAVAAGFISETARQIPVVGTTPTELIEKLLAKVDC
jgi:predicted Rossmann-fold nucleotide-binding protein